MIGLALVAAGGVLGSSLVKSANAIIDRSVGADFIVTTKNFAPIPATVAKDMQAVDGVDAVTEFRAGQAKIAGSVASLQGVTSDTVDRTLQLDMVRGNLDALSKGELVVSDKLAKDKKWQIGTKVPVVFGETGKTELTVGGTYKENQIAGNYLIGLETYDHNFTQDLDQVVAMTVKPGADLTAVRKDITAAAGASNLEVRDQSEFKAEQRKQINMLLGLVYVLLGLAIFIAALGIVNTLALSVVERTREIGLLRAVGMGRRQVRRMVRLEAVIIAIFGTLLGIVLGVAIGSALVNALHDQGIDQLVIPIGQLVIYFAIGSIIGVLAALWPARRAAKLNVLKAITTE